MSIIIPTVTNAGLKAIFDAQSGNLEAHITHVAFGFTPWSADATTVALKGEQFRTRVADSKRIDAAHIHITAIEDSNLSYWIYEIGFFLDNGALFAIATSKDKPFGYKAEGQDLLLAFDLKLDHVTEADGLTIVGDTDFALPAATTENRGIIRIAKLEEATIGTDNDAAITPYTLHNILEGGSGGRYVYDIDLSGDTFSNFYIPVWWSFPTTTDGFLGHVTSTSAETVPDTLLMFSGVGRYIPDDEKYLLEVQRYLTDIHPSPYSHLNIHIAATLGETTADTLALPYAGCYLLGGRRYRFVTNWPMAPQTLNAANETREILDENGNGSGIFAMSKSVSEMTAGDPPLLSPPQPPITEKLRIATQSEVNIGEINDAAVSPLTLKGKLGQIIADEPTTLNVPADFPTIQAAWDSLDGKIINTNITIQVADGNHIIDTPVRLANRFDANNITIVGNIASPSSCILQVNSSDGIVISNVHGVRFSGFSIIGTVNITKNGIIIEKNADVFSEPDSLIIENCDTGLTIDNARYTGHGITVKNVENGAVIDNNSFAELDRFTANGRSKQIGDGIFANHEAVVNAENAFCTNFDDGYSAANNAQANFNNSSSDNCSFGYYIFLGATVEANKSAVSNCNAYGFTAIQNATIFAHSSSVTNCGGFAYFCVNNSMMDVNDATAKQSKEGFRAENTSTITASRAIIDSCSVAFTARTVSNIATVDPVITNCDAEYVTAELGIINGITGDILSSLIIDKPTTINVPGDYPNIQAAWNSLQGKILKSDITIKVQDGTHNTTRIEIYDHPNADHIRIEGNITDPRKCIIHFVADANNRSYGILFWNVRKINISGFHLTGVIGETYRGIYIANHCHVISSPGSIIIDNCDKGIEIYGSSLYSCESITINNCINSIYASNGSTISLPKATINGQGNHIGFGANILEHARLHADSAIIKNCEIAFSATHNAHIKANFAQVSNSGNSGFLAHGAATIEAANATADSCNIGFYSRFNSEIHAPSSFVNNCITAFLAETLGTIMADETTITNCQNDYTTSELGFIHKVSTIPDNGVQIATQAEVDSGIVDTAAVSPKGLHNLPVPTETFRSLIRIASPTEIGSGTVKDAAISPAGLQTLRASEMQYGIIRTAGSSDMLSTSINDAAITPMSLSMLPSANEFTRSIIRMASSSEVTAGQLVDAAISPATLNTALQNLPHATESTFGITRLATANEVDSLTSQYPASPAMLVNAMPDADEQNRSLTRYASIDETKTGQINTAAVTPAGLKAAIDTKENALGNPSLDGQVLASLRSGFRGWVSLPSQQLFKNLGTFTASSGGNTEIQFGTSYTLPAGTLNNNEGLYIYGNGEFSTNTNFKTFRVYIGDTLLIENNIVRAPTGSFEFSIRMWRINSSILKGSAKLLIDGNNAEVQHVQTANLNIDTSSQLIRTTAQSVDTNTITRYTFIVEKIT